MYLLWTKTKVKKKKQNKTKQNINMKYEIEDFLFISVKMFLRVEEGNVTLKLNIKKQQSCSHSEFPGPALKHLR